MESKSEDADDVDCDNMATMSQGGLSHGKTTKLLRRGGEWGVMNCEDSHWRFLAQAHGNSAGRS